MEVQQRSVEYSVLFNKHNNLRPGVLEPMPQFERPPKEEDEDEDDGEVVTNENIEASTNVPAPAQPAAEQVHIISLFTLRQMGYCNNNVSSSVKFSRQHNNSTIFHPILIKSQNCFSSYIKVESLIIFVMVFFAISSLLF